MPASHSIQMYSQQWDMPLPSKFNPINPSAENYVSMATIPQARSSSTQEIVSSPMHLSLHRRQGTTSADNLNSGIDPINTPDDFSGAFPYNIASPGTSGGSKSPPNSASSELPQDLSIPSFSHLHQTWHSTNKSRQLKLLE